MKELCETIFCFWRKCCKQTNTKIVPIESGTMINKNKDQQTLYSKLVSPNLNEKNVFKFKEAEMSTALTIEEVIFPLKYLNITEANPSFNFDFTKDKIISFIEVVSPKILTSSPNISFADFHSIFSFLI